MRRGEWCSAGGASYTRGDRDPRAQDAAPECGLVWSRIARPAGVKTAECRIALEIRAIPHRSDLRACVSLCTASAVLQCACTPQGKAWLTLKRVSCVAAQVNGVNCISCMFA